MIKIMIVEDQSILRDSLETMLNAEDDMQVACAVGAASMAPEMCRRLEIDLVLMDVMTENNENGIEVAAMLRKEFPDLKIVIMTGMPEITFVRNARLAGADSFIYKNIRKDALLSTLRSTMDGYGTYPGKVAKPGLLSYEFTDTELDILRLFCSAMSRKEVAAELNMSEGAVKAAITGILNKTGYNSIMKFAVHAVANGYIAPRD